MSTIDLTIGTLFEKVFGYQSTAFDPKFDKVVGDRVNDINRKDTSALGSPYYGLDIFGREYYLPIKVSYVEDATTGILKYVELPHPVLAISSSKNIVKTQLTERRGTVKELINVDDYKISIKGFAIAKTNEFPEDVITTLRELYEQNVVIGISNAITDIFLLRPDRKGSDKVVITDFRLPQVVGVKNVRPYELELLSDEIFNLIDTS